MGGRLPSFSLPFFLFLALCCHADSYHHLETVFEHFSCKSIVPESWSHHSFCSKPGPDVDAVMGYLAAMTKVLDKYKPKLHADEKKLLLNIKNVLVKESNRVQAQFL